MNLRMVAISALAALAWGYGAAQAANCSTRGTSAPFGVDITGNLVVSTGHACGSRMRPGNGTIMRVHVVEQAKHGTVWLPALNTWLYRSKPGYVGKDSFIIAITGNTSKSSGTSNMSIDVDVTP